MRTGEEAYTSHQSTRRSDSSKYCLALFSSGFTFGKNDIPNSIGSPLCIGVSAWRSATGTCRSAMPPCLGHQRAAGQPVAIRASHALMMAETFHHRKEERYAAYHPCL